MEPHLVRWHNKWSAQGLVVIEVDNGSIDSLEEIEQHVMKEKIPFAFVHDKGGTICNRYRVQAYPAAYLLDKQGQVIWEGHPFEIEAIEKSIAQALAAGEKH